MNELGACSMMFETVPLNLVRRSVEFVEMNCVPCAQIKENREFRRKPVLFSVLQMIVAPSNGRNKRWCCMLINVKLKLT